MALSVPSLPDGVFPFTALPFELRDKIYRYAVTKDGYIGEADPNGVECAVGAKHASGNKSSLADASDRFHFPSGCRHPDHEKKQLCKDFRDYCLNLALTCSWVYQEVFTIFFRQNGFELHSPDAMLQFFTLIGMHRFRQIRKFRLYRNINLDIDEFHSIFEGRVLNGKRFYQILELEYLNDDEPGSLIVGLMRFLKTSSNVQEFDLIYRFEIPGNYFDVVRAGVGNALGWSGESLKWDMKIDNLFPKLRQDIGERTDETFNVAQSKLEANHWVNAVGTAWGLDPFYSLIADVVRRACVAHVENCIDQCADQTAAVGWTHPLSTSN